MNTVTFQSRQGASWKLSVQGDEAAALLCTGAPPVPAEPFGDHHLMEVGCGQHGRIYRRPVRGGIAAAPQLLAIFGLDGHQPRPFLLLHPDTRLRLTLAEAFSQAPEVLLITLPVIEEKLAAAIREAARHTGRAVICRAGNLACAEALGGRIVLTGEGRLLQEGTAAELCMHPACLQAADWLPGLNRLQATVIARGPDNRLALDLSGFTIPSYAWGSEPALEQQVTLLVHRDQIRFSAQMHRGFHFSALSGRFRGAPCLELPDGQRLTELPPMAAEDGARLFVWWDPACTGAV